MLKKNTVNRISDAKTAWKEIEPYADWFDNSITKAYGDTYDGATFYLFTNSDNEVVGLGIAGYKDNDDIYSDKDTQYLEDVPFIWELGTCVNMPEKKEKGAALFIIDAILDDYEEMGFWLKTLDSKAESFWRHVAEKYKLECIEVGETAWGTPILDLVEE